jgi:hypothetical protein
MGTSRSERATFSNAGPPSRCGLVARRTDARSGLGEGLPVRSPGKRPAPPQRPQPRGCRRERRWHPCGAPGSATVPVSRLRGRTARAALGAPGSAGRSYRPRMSLATSRELRLPQPPLPPRPCKPATALLEALDRRSCGLAQERRGRDPRRAAKALEDESDLVEVAPAPVLARFERADDRVRRGVMVRGRVAVG